MQESVLTGPDSEPTRSSKAPALLLPLKLVTTTLYVSDLGAVNVIRELHPPAPSSSPTFPKVSLELAPSRRHRVAQEWVGEAYIRHPVQVLAALRPARHAISYDEPARPQGKRDFASPAGLPRAPSKHPATGGRAGGITVGSETTGDPRTPRRANEVGIAPRATLAAFRGLGLTWRQARQHTPSRYLSELVPTQCTPREPVWGKITLKTKPHIRIFGASEVRPCGPAARATCYLV